MRRKASDLLVAVALLHGADHLAGSQPPVPDQRPAGGVVAAVVKGLPYRRPTPNRQLRRTRFEASTRRIPPRYHEATFTSRTSMAFLGSAPSTRAAIRSSAIAAAFTSPWFVPAQPVPGDRTSPFT